MSNTEKNIVTTIMWGIAVVVGYCTAEAIYNAGMTGYLKHFHKDAWNEAMKQVIEEGLA